MKKIFVLSLLMMIFTTPSLAVTSAGILEDGDFNNSCGTYHVLTAVFEQGFSCSSGKYLPQGGTTASACASCLPGYYCEGIGTNDTHRCSFETGQYLCYSDSAASGPMGLTGVCNSGTFSTGGASSASCTTCPNNPLTWSTPSPNTNIPTDYDEQSDCTYTFILNKNGGSGTISNDSGDAFSDAGGTTAATITCHYGTVCNFGDPSSLSNSDGYTFSGWGSTVDCSTADPQTSFNSSTLTQETYYACRKGVMSGAITLNTDGAAKNGNPNPIYVQYNTAFYNNAAGTNEITTVNRPGKPDKVFVGFYDADNVKRIDETGKIMNDVKTLARFKTAGRTETWTAHYENTYKIILDPDPYKLGGITDVGTDKLYGVSTTKGASAAGAYTDPWSIVNVYDENTGTYRSIDSTPKKTGYTFAGYYSEGFEEKFIDANGVVQPVLVTRAKNSNSGFTLKASWTPNTIAIIWYDVQDAGARSESVQYDGDIITPAKATEKPHYKFNGWKFSLVPNN